MLCKPGDRNDMQTVEQMLVKREINVTTNQNQRIAEEQRDEMEERSETE